MPDTQPTNNKRDARHLSEHQRYCLKVAKDTLEMLSIYDKTGKFSEARDEIAELLRTKE